MNNIALKLISEFDFNLKEQKKENSIVNQFVVDHTKLDSLKFNKMISLIDQIVNTFLEISNITSSTSANEKQTHQPQNNADADEVKLIF